MLYLLLPEHLMLKNVISYLKHILRFVFFYHKSVNLVHMGVVNYLDKYSCLEAAVLPHSVNLILILQCFVTVGSVI